MPFNITVKNVGVDGTIDVTEQLNLNENIVVFSGIIESGNSVPVQCQGDPPKEFTWLHHATNVAGGPASFGDGGEIDVES
jgi:hypothetical protein